MCRLVAVAALEHETFELLEEQSADRLATHPLAMQFEQAWELDAAEYDDFPSDEDAFEQDDFDR